MPTLAVGDVHLYYEMAGAGKPLLFLHGLGSSTRDWERQVPFFAEQYQVVTVDMRGHGRSSQPPGPYSMALFARDTAALMRRLDLAPAHIVGISMGGMIALQLALDAPACVRSLAIVNSMPAVPVRGLRRRLQFFGRRLFVRCFGMRAVGRVLGRRLFPEAEDIQQEFATRWAQNDRHRYLDALGAITGWSVTERLPAITCPTLVLTADSDYTTVAEKRSYAARLPNARVVVVRDARHALPVERPEAFNAALAAFLREHRATSRTP